MGNEILGLYKPEDDINENTKLIVAFDVVTVPEDQYVGFAGY